MSGQTFDGPPPGSAVSRGRSHFTPAARIGIAAAVGLGVVGFAGYTMMPGKPKAPSIETFNHGGGRPWSAPTLPALPVKAPPVLPVAKVDAPDTPRQALPPVAAPVPVAQPMGFWQSPSVVEGAQSAAQQAAASRIGGAGSGSGADAAALAGMSPQDIGTDPAQRHAGIARATVGKPFDLHFLLKRNTIFHCIPEQPLDSDVPGPIGCTVAEDVMSADGSVVLIEKGSSVDGEVTRAPGAGSNRMFVEFDELLTLSGIPIYLSGTGGDTLGTSGVDGAVNEHLWRKIRAAVLLSAIEVAGQVAENESQKNNNLNLNVGGTGESLADQALAHDINIPPTLYRNQADRITVTVRQDIPMDDAYRLVARDGAQ